MSELRWPWILHTLWRVSSLLPSSLYIMQPPKRLRWSSERLCPGQMNCLPLPHTACKPQGPLWLEHQSLLASLSPSPQAPGMWLPHPRSESAPRNPLSSPGGGCMVFQNRAPGSRDSDSKPGFGSAMQGQTSLLCSAVSSLLHCAQSCTCLVY